MRVDLHTREVGEGLPLVLLHAFPLSSSMWLGQREGLADVCRVLTPDLRGFGGSPGGDDEPSLDPMADDVARLLDGRGLDRVVLGGQSMGGYVAMAFLRRHRDRVAALVLADTKATPDTAEAREKRERIAGTLESEGTPRVLIDDVLPGLLGPTTMQRRPLVFGRVRGLVQATPAAAAAWAARAMASRPDSTDTLAETDVPTLVVVGEEDELTSPTDAEAMLAALPDARLVRLSDAGHLSAIEAPEAFNAVLREFVAKLSA